MYTLSLIVLTLLTVSFLHYLRLRYRLHADRYLKQMVVDEELEISHDAETKGYITLALLIVAIIVVVPILLNYELAPLQYIIYAVFAGALAASPFFASALETRAT